MTYDQRPPNPDDPVEPVEPAEPVAPLEPVAPAEPVDEGTQVVEPAYEEQPVQPAAGSSARSLCPARSRSSARGRSSSRRLRGARRCSASRGPRRLRAAGRHEQRERRGQWRVRRRGSGSALLRATRPLPAVRDPGHAADPSDRPAAPRREPGNDIVDFVYSVTEPFVAPFRGIFQFDAVASGDRTLDIAALVALIGWTLIYALIMAILRLADRSTS